MIKKKWIQTYRNNKIHVSIGFIFYCLFIACAENEIEPISSLSEVFNGFDTSQLDEIYAVVTFEREGKFHKSNPIRLKQSSKPTKYQANTTIDQSEALMPIFSRQDGVFPENAMYSHVISDSDHQFISGTYTFDQWFQYYKLSNVLLNSNREISEDLVLGEPYNFSMLAVSLDNWVNLVIEKPFTAQ